MGSPRVHIKKKFERPSHPWQRLRIDEENELKRTYGFNKKEEIWRIESVLRNFRAQARKLIGTHTAQAEREKSQLLARLCRLGLVEQNAKIESVLGLSLRDIAERRLQTVLKKKGLANTVKQARQFITHGHVMVGDKKIRSPSHLILREEEGSIIFSANSPIANPSHPARMAKVEAKQNGKAQ